MKRCSKGWFHAWDMGVWMGGIALPILRFTCLKCGATMDRRYGP